MRKLGMVCLAVVICSGLSASSWAQKKPGAQPADKIPPPAHSKIPPPAQIQRPSGAQNIAVVRRVFDDLFNGGRYEAVNEIYTRDCAVHFGNRNSGLQEAVAEGKGWRSAAPDLHMTVEKISADGDRVVVEWMAKGTNTSKGNGVPATGKRILIHGQSTFRVVNGKITEVWNSDHRPELYRQLGVPRTVARFMELTEDLWVAFTQYFSRTGSVEASVKPFK